ncbi:MAG: OmpA family protein [Clostridia bacterium]|nr:OmpA family protein [Clostridia bacterium]
MARKKIEAEESGGAPEWMTTYSDLVTLLLTFFILLFSMAVLDKQKFQEVAFSLKSSLTHKSNGEMFMDNTGKEIFSVMDQVNVADSDENSQKNDDVSKNTSSGDSKEKIEKMIKDFQKAIDELKLNDLVKVLEEDEQVILRVDSVVLFDLGSADIKESGKVALQKLSEVLKSVNNEIIVQGHTDNIPVNTYLFPTNWELSTKRATNVVLFLVNNCGLKPTKLTATGNGEFKPIAPNDSDQNRQKNRRIDILIQK